MVRKIATVVIQKLREPSSGDKFYGKKFCTKIDGRYIYKNQDEDREKILWDETKWKNFIQDKIITEFGSGDYMVVAFLGYAKIKRLFRGWVE